jgi:excisionase family DNA binding protein
MEKMPGKFLTTTEVAKRMHIHPNTVRRWTDQGKLNTQQRIGPRGARRFSEEEINNFRDVDLTSSQAAKKMYVHVNTVIRWADQADKADLVRSVSVLVATEDSIVKKLRIL